MADLPALRTTTTGGGGVAGSLCLATAVIQALDAAKGPSTDDRAAGREPRTICEAYKETYPVLLRYNQVKDAAGVAPIWDRLAKCHKGEQQTILQQEFAKVCNAWLLDPELECTAVTTTALKQILVSFNFTGFGPDNLL